MGSIDDFITQRFREARPAPKPGPLTPPPYDPMQGCMNTMFDFSCRSQNPEPDVFTDEDYDRVLPDISP